MAHTKQTDPKPDVAVNEKLESLRNMCREDIREFAKLFFGWDIAINNSIKEISDSVAAAVRSNDAALIGGIDNEDVRQFVNALKQAKNDSSGSAAAGMEMTAARIDLSPLKDLGDFIGNIKDFVKEEKQFLMAILLLIFCEHPCECICEYINKK